MACMTLTREITFFLNISYEQFFLVYSGSAKNVVTRAEDGRTVRFAAPALKPYLTHEGVKGRFVISFDEKNRFQALKKIG